MSARKGSTGRSGTARKGGKAAGKRKGGNSRKRVKGSSSVSGSMPGWVHWSGTIILLALVAAGAFFVLLKPYFYRWKPCFGEKEYSVCLPSGYLYYGIDVSHHQGRIDWQRVAASSAVSEYPLKFVIMKATEGGTFKDPNLEENLTAAREAGFVCGVYHFFNPASSPSVQAAFFRDNVQLTAGDLVPVVDVETEVKDVRKLQKDLSEFLGAVESFFGVKPVIYTSVKFRRRYLNAPAFSQYCFWVAHYYVDEPATDLDWSFWQFSDRARIDGIYGLTDIDVFRGTETAFDSLRLKK
ncbi:MAG: glycoside hydrolase family 25 protein [Bacteroidaceae bacterium]|nr:glycoside hydrolase family 25 protein [Bacteroidaceae bacterium]